MTVGIAGLGLIGGSLARAYHDAGHRVLCHDIDESILMYAQLANASDGTLDAQTLPECDLVLIALYPRAAADYLSEIAPLLPQTAVVIDCCGTKKDICDAGFPLAERYGFTFVGGHPMAGTQYSGFKHSRATLFKGASMVIVPPVYDDIDFLQNIKNLLAPLQLGRLTVTTAEEHDAMIAFTSQMAHVVSNAFIKSPTARSHKGFSAGSYKDLTRVAWLNETMWTELFLANRENLIREVDILIDELTKYRDAMAENDAPRLQHLLAEGRMIKEEVDGR